MGRWAGIWFARKFPYVKAMILEGGPPVSNINPVEQLYRRHSNLAKHGILKGRIFKRPICRFLNATMEYDLWVQEVIDNIPGLDIPLYFIFGENDDVLFYDDVKSVYEIYKGKKDMWIVKDGGHIDSYFYQKAEYTKNVTAFFKREMMC